MVHNSEKKSVNSLTGFGLQRSYVARFPAHPNLTTADTLLCSREPTKVKAPLLLRLSALRHGDLFAYETRNNYTHHRRRLILGLVALCPDRGAEDVAHEN